MATSNAKVKLTTGKRDKDGKISENKTREFDEQTALKLLSASNAKWKLPKDSNYSFNGKELSKKK